MMKKVISSIALASIATPLMAADIDEANLNFYGSLRLMLERAESTDDTQYKDALSRVGLTAEYDLGEGLSAFTKYELGLNLADDADGDSISNLRHGHIGLKNEDFGAVSFGKVWSPFYEAIGFISDYMWWNSAPVYYTLDGGLHVAETVHYASPDMSGLKFRAMLQVDDGDETNKEQSQYSATYSLGNVTLAGAYTAAADDNNQAGFAIAYSGDGFYTNAGYIDKENVGAGVDALVGVPLGKHLVTLGVSDFSSDEEDKDFTAGILAYQYKLHSKVLLWAELMAWEGTLYGVEESNQTNIGINFNF